MAVFCSRILTVGPAPPIEPGSVMIRSLAPSPFTSAIAMRLAPDTYALADWVNTLTGGAKVVEELAPVCSSTLTPTLSVKATSVAPSPFRSPTTTQLAPPEYRLLGAAKPPGEFCRNSDTP